MVDSEYSADSYKSLKVNIGTITKSPQMIRFVPDHLKTKKRYKNAVEKPPCVTRYDSY